MNLDEVTPEEQVERETKEARKAEDALRVLTQSDGWKILLRMARKQIREREQKVCYSQLDDVWTSLQQEYVKGELMGIRTFMTIPGNVLKNIDANKELDEDAAGSDTADDPYY